MKTIRVKAERTVIEEADVLIRVPEQLTESHPMYGEYIENMVYDIANLNGDWELAETTDCNWSVIADPFIEGQL